MPILHRVLLAIYSIVVLSIGTVGLAEQDPSLVAYYRFEERDRQVIEDVRVYNGALTAAQISRHYLQEATTRGKYLSAQSKPKLSAHVVPATNTPVIEVAHGDYRYTTPRDGWVLIRSPDEPEAMRYQTEGEHMLHIKGKGSLIVRAISEIITVGET